MTGCGGSAEPATGWLLRPFPVAAAAILLAVLPVLLFRWFPTHDGPAHLSTASTLRLLAAPEARSLHRYFVANWQLSTNQFAALALSSLSAWMPVAVAGKLYLASLLTLLAAGVVLCVRNLAPANVPLALLFVPYLGGYLVHVGLLNFIPALILFLATLLFAYRSLPEIAPGRAVVLAGLLLATYFLHVITAALLAGVITAYAFASTWVAGGRLLRQVRTMLLCALAVLPTAVLAVSDYVAIARLEATTDALAPDLAAGAGTTAMAGRSSGWISAATSASGLVSYSAVDALFEAALLAVMAMLVLWSGRQIVQQRRIAVADAWLLPIVSLSALFVLVPWQIEGFFRQRLMLCLLLVVCFWLWTQPYPRRLVRRVGLLLLLLNLAFLGWRMHWIAATDRLLDEYAGISASIADADSVFALSAPSAFGWRVCLDLDRDGLPCRIRPHLQFAGDVIGDRPIANLSNYQAGLPFFPLAFAPGAEDLAGLIEVAKGRDRLWTEAATPGERHAVGAILDRQAVDAVIFWNDRTAGDGGARYDDAAAQMLGPAYRLVWTSRPRGLVTLFRRVPAAQTGVAKPSSKSSVVPEREP